MRSLLPSGAKAQLKGALFLPTDSDAEPVDGPFLPPVQARAQPVVFFQQQPEILYNR